MNRNQKVTEARPLKKHHVNVNVQKTVQSWKCRLTLSFMRFFLKRRWTIGLNREGL